MLINGCYIGRKSDVFNFDCLLSTIFLYAFFFHIVVARDMCIHFNGYVIALYARATLNFWELS
jgi:hypothetical protein